MGVRPQKSYIQHFGCDFPNYCELMYIAEYLPRLEQITLKIETTDAVSDIKALGIQDRQLILQTSSIHSVPLPLRGTSLGDIKITNITKNGDTMTIVLSAGRSNAMESTFMSLADSKKQLWSVSDLLQKTPKNKQLVNEFQFVCAGCGTTIVDSVNSKFMDMPLEYWHELMDFWHCHKPHDEHHNDNEKHYDGKLIPRDGFVNIGSYYILLPGRNTNCKLCGKVLGDLEEGCVKLFKWNLKLRYLDKTETYPPYALIYYLILDKVNSSALRSFTIKARGSGESVHVWVANVGLGIAVPRGVYDNVLKILYRDTSNDSEDDILEVPDVAYQSFMDELTGTTGVLPKDCRTVEMTTDGTLHNNQVSYLMLS